MARRRTVGFIGLGAMGTPISRHIQDGGWRLVVYNRDREATKQFASRGAMVADSPRQVAENADIIFIMVTDDDAVRDVVYGEQGVLAGISEGKILVDMTTSSPGLALELEGAAEEKGARTLDVRVSGSVETAEQAELLVLIGGEPQIIDKVCPILELLGRKFVRTGGHGTAAVVKLALNIILGLEMQAVAEAMVLASKSGVSPGVVSEAVSISGMASPFIAGKLKMIQKNDYKRRFSLRLMQKDLRLALGEADKSSTPLPATAATNESAKSGVAAGLGDLDMVVLYPIEAKLAGTKVGDAAAESLKEPAQSI